jgi:ankyrin repeat protein
MEKMSDMMPRWYEILPESSGETMREIIYSIPLEDIDREYAGRGTSLLHAVWANRTDMVSLLLERGANPRPDGGYVKDPLWMSITSTKYHEIAISRLLLDAGARIDDYYLFTCIYRGDIERLYLLLEYGADPNVGNNKRRTPIIDASRLDAYDAVSLLLKYGADPHIRDKDGKDAFDHTEERDMHMLLLSYTDSLYSKKDRSKDYFSSSMHDVDIVFSL